jgi:hypothetical protein
MAQDFGGSAPELVPEDVPDGSDYLLIQDRIREFRSMSQTSTLDRLSNIREDQRLEHSLFGHLVANGWPSEIAFRVRIMFDGLSYVPMAPRYLHEKVAFYEYESELKGAIQRWTNAHALELDRLSEDQALVDSQLAVMM